MNSRLLFSAFLTATLLATAGFAWSQDGEPPPAAASEPPAPLNVSGAALTIGPEQVFDMFFKGSVLHIGTMWALLCSSILTLTIALERLIVLRSSRVVPRTFVDRFLDRLRDGDLDRGKAREMCRDNGRPIANIFAIAVNHSGQPASEIRDAVSEGAQSELYYLRRRVRALNGLATLAPLLGLFGTVIGMIEAFHALSQQAGAGKTELLARGISLALVATATGLSIAIVAAASYYFLLGRLDRIVQEMDVLTNEVIEHLAASSRLAEKATRPRVVPAREQASV